MTLIEFKGSTAVPIGKVLALKHHEGKVFVHVALNVYFEIEDTYDQALQKYKKALIKEDKRLAALVAHQPPLSMEIKS